MSVSLELLKEYVELSLLEEGRGFSIDKFKKLAATNPVDAFNYAHNNLRFMGKGSARSTYLLSSGKILKMANCSQSRRDVPCLRGYAQNEAEVNVFTDPATKNIVSKIYDYDPKYSWLISELVRPFEYEEDFSRLLDVDKNPVIDLDRMAMAALRPERIPEFVARHATNGKKLEDFMMSLAAIIRSSGVLTGDLGKVNHYGKTADGRVVLLDYGFTNSVANQHY